MPDFSNRADSTPEDVARYVRDLLALLGDRDPLEVQRGLVPALREAVAGLSDAERRRPEAPGKWSVLDVLMHLADSEVVLRYRMRKIVAQPGSPIAGYDQDAWAAGLHYGEGDAGEALALIEGLRTGNLRWLGGLTEDELAREGIHAERGRESVWQLVQLLAAHDLVHLRQIERIKAAR